MAVSERVIVELEARLGRYEANVSRAERKFDSAMGGIQRSANATEGLVARAMGGITAALAGVSAIALARTFLEYADAAKTLDAQLRLATAGFGTFAKAQEDVRRIAADTRSGLQETASLYGNFSRGAKELGEDQEAAARATETFSKTLKISGADANQAASATLQFGQALAAGALRGDELNSVLEAAPRLARLLTESLGLPIGKIKELGEEGKLTSEVLLNALTNQKFTAGIDREFAELPVTFSDAMTQIENAAIITFGAFDRGGQFSTALANFVTDGSDGFKDLEQDAVEMGIAIRSNIEGLVGAFDPILDEAKRFFEYVNGQQVKVDIRRDIDKSAGQIDTFLGTLANQEGPLEQWINAKLYGSTTGRTNLQGRFRQSQAASQTRLERVNGQTPVSRVLGKLSEANRNAEQTPVQRGGAASASDSDRKKAAAAARKAENERLRAIREDASNARDSANLQDDINSAKAALAVATEDILRYNLQSIENEKSQRTAEYETRFKLGQIGQRELDDRIKAVNEIADLQRQRVEQIAAENQRREDLSRLQASITDNSDLLRAEADLVTNRKQRRDIELRLLDLATEQERAEQEAVLASGTATDAQKEIAEQRLRILDQLKGYRAERINRDAEGPLASYSRKLRETDVNDQIESYVVDELQSVQDSIASGIQKKLGVKDPLLAGLINLFIEQAIIKPIAEALAKNSGGSGNVLGSVVGSIGGAIFGGGRAIGGPVKAGVAYDVGESGRERFVPQQAGVIVPNHRLKGNSGGTTVQQTFVLDARGGITTPELIDYVNQTANARAVQASSAMGQAVLKAVPARISSFQRDGL